MARFISILKSGLTGAVDLLWPPMCPTCDEWVSTPGTLCSTCWETLVFLGEPQCTSCGLPFEFDQGPDALCGACVRARPPYNRARSAVVYDEASRKLILPFKHADRTDIAPTLVNMMRRPAMPLLSDATVVTPVPLHWGRYLSRKYNQSALLSEGVANCANVRSVPDLLVRHRKTGSQGGRSIAGRRRNVEGAFAVRPLHRKRLRDASVLLVDDVMTTGATVEACARTLLRGGAASVDVITFARVFSTGL